MIKRVCDYVHEGRSCLSSEIFQFSIMKFLVGSNNFRSGLHIYILFTTLIHKVYCSFISLIFDSCIFCPGTAQVFYLSGIPDQDPEVL